MRRRWEMTVLAGGVLAMLAGSGASAIEMSNSRNIGADLARQQAAQLQALQSQIQRQQFQQQQQFYREDDRRAAPVQPLPVPKMKPSCQARSYYGVDVQQSCR